MANIKITDFTELVDIGKPNVVIPVVDKDDTTMDASGTNLNVNMATMLTDSNQYVQGYYSLLTDFYFTAGTPTSTTIGADDIDQWIDVNITIAPNNSNEGLFDYRPDAMKNAQAVGHTGAGTQVDPIVFSLEGLNLRSFCSFRSSLTFEPDADEGQLEARLLFQRHSGTTPSTDFDITETVLSMSQGAAIEYFAEPFLSFFIGDTIDTNGVGDAGSFRFQIKANVQGTLRTRAFSLYVNR